MAPTGIDKLTDRLRNVMKSKKDDKEKKNVDKPDSREPKLGGSPISPLKTNRPSQLSGTLTATTTTTTTTTSSSSSSSGSISGRTSGPTTSSTTSNLGRRTDSKAHSGDLSGSIHSSPTGPRKSSGSGSGSASPVEPRKNSGSGSGSGSPAGARKSSDSGSGSLSAGSSRSRHARSVSCGSNPQKLSGGSGGKSTTVSSPRVPILPAGNICPSGKVITTGMVSNKAKTELLGSGNVDYSRGNIMRSGVGPKAGGASGGVLSGTAAVGGSAVGGQPPIRTAPNDPEDFKRAGNEYYQKGNMYEALNFYDKAITLSPGNAAYHFNRSAALMGLNRLPEAVKECEHTIRLDPKYMKAHHRLGALFLSLGQVENARRHLSFPGIQADPDELKKLQAVEKHLTNCTDARKAADWIGTLRETDAAIASGANSSPQLFACKAEALLKLYQVDDAARTLSNMPQFGSATASYSETKFFGMLSEAYPSFVRAQIALAQGRFENAITAVEKAAEVDARNVEVSLLVKNVRLVARARDRGNALFKSERFTEACSAYAEGLKLDPSNSILYCNRAACLYKLRQWERSLDDCNQALRLHPNYQKALLRRAASYTMLERWAEAVKDYEVLRKELPHDNDIAEQLFHAQVALKKSRGEEVSNMKFGGEVELVTGHEQFRASISSPSTCIVHFKTALNIECKQISSSLDKLCTRHPSINFLTVDIEDCPAIADAENVRIVPTVKIYKKGSRVKEIICPSPEVLESSVRHYSS